MSWESVESTEKSDMRWSPPVASLLSPHGGTNPFFPSNSQVQRQSRHTKEMNRAPIWSRFSINLMDSAARWPHIGGDLSTKFVPPWGDRSEATGGLHLISDFNLD